MAKLLPPTRISSATSHAAITFKILHRKTGNCKCFPGSTITLDPFYRTDNPQYVCPYAVCPNAHSDAFQNHSFYMPPEQGDMCKIKHT